MKMKRRKKNIFRESVSYIRESMPFIVGAIVIFLGSMIVGIAFPENFRFFDDILKDLAQKIEGLSTLELILFIFQNNATGAILAIVLGVFVGIVPIFNSLLNGALLGYVLARATELGGLSVIWKLVPHGIFELPAIFISFGLGIKLGMFVFAKKKKKEFFRRLFASLKVFLTIILPLLIIAAIIEGFLIAFD